MNKKNILLKKKTWKGIDPLKACKGSLVAMSLRPNERIEVHHNWYKVAVEVDEGRRRRKDNMMEICKTKSKHEKSLQKNAAKAFKPLTSNPSLPLSTPPPPPP